MAVQGLVVTLSSGTASVVAGDGGPHGVLRVTVRNRGTGSAFLGSSGVTTAGYQLSSADNPLQLMMGVGETLYACCTGAAVLDVLRNLDTT